MNIIDDNKDQVARLCLRYSVKELYLFGSALREDFGQDSDIDLAAVFLRNGVAGSFDQYFNFKAELERLLERPVDIVCPSCIRNSILKREIEETQRLIYAA